MSLNFQLGMKLESLVRKKTEHLQVLKHLAVKSWTRPQTGLVVDNLHHDDKDLVAAVVLSGDEFHAQSCSIVTRCACSCTSARWCCQVSSVKKNLFLELMPG